MTCADNISAVQREKRACRVKCTIHAQGQEATKTNGTTLTESKGKNGLRTAWIYPYLEKNSATRFPVIISAQMVESFKVNFSRDVVLNVVPVSDDQVSGPTSSRI